MRRLLKCLLWVSLCVASTGCLAAQPADDAPTGTGSISGTVVNGTTGAPLRRVHVELQVFEDPTLTAGAPTDASGRFTIHNLPPGKFTITAWRRDYARISYGATTPDGAGEVVTLKAGEQRDGISFRLPLLAVIAGAVYNADGDPLAGATVEVGQRSFFRGKPTVLRIRTEQTDDRGRFRMFDLLAGSYVISADAQAGFGMRFGMRFGNPQPVPDGNAEPEVTYRKTYYGGSPTAAGATTVTVSGTQPADGIELRLASVRMAHISGEVTAPFSLETNQVNITLMSTSDDAPFNTSFGANQGHFETMPIREGTYRLQCTAEVDGKVYVGVQTIDLIGGDRQGVSLQLRPAVDVAGIVDLDGRATGGVRVQFVSPDNGNGPAFGRGRFNRGRFDQEDAEVGPDGKFVVKNVLPGVWDINVGPVPKGGYLKAMMLGTDDVLRKEMTIGAEAPPPLRISLSSRAAEVSGQVQGARKGVVLLAPDGLTADVMSFYERVIVDNQGKFVVRGITPGPYRLYAFTRLKREAWADPNFLLLFHDRGVAVDLKEGDKQTVDIPQLIDLAPIASDPPENQQTNPQATFVPAGVPPPPPPPSVNQ